MTALCLCVSCHGKGKQEVYRNKPSAFKREERWDDVLQRKGRHQLARLKCKTKLHLPAVTFATSLILLIFRNDPHSSDTQQVNVAFGLCLQLVSLGACNIHCQGSNNNYRCFIGVASRSEIRVGCDKPGYLRTMSSLYPKQNLQSE